MPFRLPNSTLCLLWSPQGGRGESWSPDFSTVLQVLISIQARAGCWAAGLECVVARDETCLLSPVPGTPALHERAPPARVSPLTLFQSLILVDEPWYKGLLALSFFQPHTNSPAAL